MAHPERWLHRKVETQKERVLLTGEAAGIEPWLGEGIAYSMGYATTVANSIIEALQTGDFTFSNHNERLKNSPIGRKLKRNRTMAKFFYHPMGHKLVPTLSRLFYNKFKNGIANRVNSVPTINAR